MGNKTHFDLKKVYYATATINPTTDVVTYGTPTRIPGAVSLNLAPDGELAPFRADGGIYMMTRSNNGYKGDMELARVPESFETDCLGAALNATDKTIGEGATNTSLPFALLFEFEGDVSAIKHVMYLCYADRFAIEGDNSDKKDPKKEKLSIVAVPRPDNGLVKYKTGDETTAAVNSAWYSSVYEPSTATPTPAPAPEETDGE